MPVRAQSSLTGQRVTFLVMLAGLGGLWAAISAWLPWLNDYPQTWVVPVTDWVGGFMDWLVNEANFQLFTFKELTRAIAATLNQPLTLMNIVLWKGVEIGGVTLPSLSWLGVMIAVMVAGHLVGGWRLSVLNVACFGYMAVFGIWESSMKTLSSVGIAVPLGCFIGTLIGIAAYRRPALERIVTPTLDFMQTVPVFAYLLPVLFLFGFGPVAAMIATMIYAMPAMVRATLLGLKTVSPEIVEFGRMAGASPRQQIWQVMLPAATPTLMVGINQVIMLSLNAVIVASLIGAGGLGFDVLKALRTLSIGQGVEAGIAIVLIAVVLDRMTYTITMSRKSHRTPDMPVWRRNIHLTLAGGAFVACYLGSFAWSWLDAYPKAFTLTTGPAMESVMDYINIHYSEYIRAGTGFLYLNVLHPFRDSLLAIPWVVVVGFVGSVAFYVGGWRLAVAITALSLFIAITGFWEKAIITVYLIGTSVVIAGLIGLPLGLWGATNDRVSRVLRVVCDTLQTLPAFVYLVPVVMLFRVGDIPAILAVILYALPPAIRYTDHGLRYVDRELVEAGTMIGCTKWQLLSRIRLPLAFPQILLGINQTILLAVSMLVITALVGTRDLGQEVYIGLSRADTGLGLVAGICVAFLAIISDRLIQAYAENRKKALGIS